MKKIKGLFAIGLLGAMSFLVAAPGNYHLYVPGKADAKDAKKDLEAQGFTTMPSFEKHFSFLDSEGGKVLLLNTLDGTNDAFTLPLAGNEKKVTILFKARGDVNPDSPATPYGVFYASLQNGPYQAILRHNSSNQIKGSTGQTSMKPDNIVSDWHDFRLVYDIADDNKAVTATAFVDGKQRHQTANYIKDRSGDFPQEFDPVAIQGQGHYVLFGENDNSTSGYARYAYVVIITDDDVSAKSLAELSSIAGFDMEKAPVIAKDQMPPSHRPSAKPVGINMTKEEASYKGNDWQDPAEIKGGVIDATSLPYSKANAEVINAAPDISSIKFSATVDPKLKKSKAKKGKFKTIQEAVDLAPLGSYIKVLPGMYYEKIKVTRPVKLIGTNPLNTIIYGYEADTGGIDGNLLVEVNLLPKDLTSAPGATQDKFADIKDATFSCANITFYNKGAEWNKTWGYTERRSIALCMKGVQQGYIENCIFLGQQDTLYLRSGRAYMKNCYIEGEVDFICGGQTVYFDACKIYSLNYANGGYITAAAPADSATKDLSYANGYVFNKCIVTGDKKLINAKKKVFLGRGAWNGGSATAGNAQAKVVYVDCDLGDFTLGSHLDDKAWADWDNVNTAAKSFFREYNCKGPGAVSKETDTRKFLTDTEYNTIYSSSEKVLGFKPEL